MNKTFKKIEEEIKELIDNPRTGLKESSDTNKTRQSLLGLFENNFETYFQERLKEVLPEKENKEHTITEFVSGNVISEKDVYGFNICRQEILDNAGIKE